MTLSLCLQTYTVGLRHVPIPFTLAIFRKFDKLFIEWFMRFADLNETSVSFNRCKKETLFVSGHTTGGGGEWRHRECIFQMSGSYPDGYKSKCRLLLFRRSYSKHVRRFSSIFGLPLLYHLSGASCCFWKLGQHFTVFFFLKTFL